MDAITTNENEPENALEVENLDAAIEELQELANAYRRLSKIKTI